MAGLQPGQMIDEYRIISKIGKGGMATVYKAYQAGVDRYVAIKVLSYHLVDSEEFLGRFKQEARLIARLEHPNILPVYDYGEFKGIPYLVMRLLDAGTLKDRMRQFAVQPVTKIALEGADAEKYLPIERPKKQPKMTLEEIDGIFSQLADALGYAHDNGVIHRDIKPSNVMLDRRGRVFLSDFGIAKLIEVAGDGSNVFTSETVQLFTATGAITGTPDYMSPEQAQGLRLDQRSDIYSLGIVLYEMLTGKVPFDAETPMAVILKQISEPLPLPSMIRPGLHPAIEAVIAKALEKSSAKRYPSMRQFLSDWKKAVAEAETPVVQAGQARPAGEDLPDGKSTPAIETPSIELAPELDKPAFDGKEPVSNASEAHIEVEAEPASRQAAQVEQSKIPSEPQTRDKLPSPPFTSAAVDSGAKKTPVSLPPPHPGSLHGLEDDPWKAQASSRQDTPEKLRYQYVKPGEEAKIFLQRGDTPIPFRQAKPEKNPLASPANRILLIASVVAMLILLIVGLAFLLNLFDLLHQVP